ncbi:glycosyltransferase family 2 protein [Glutamicibacter sp. MNS18]|uniref:glycosyltransferase family 2 protein n=1 Tax=Glutamicibacter sp. MNS18 TaxID=2989817 RepID=UPI0022358C11|nr:glycosyltransferase family 2 protein [Glutamicibacter sp. MNS18]MCW4466208.1 glycosyltransferase family 2 protein [Glutamicibacter sp. MNS18]
MTATISSEKPLLSIVSAVFNVERYLQRYLDSLDDQEVDRHLFETIFVLDGSTDGSEEIIEAWGRDTTVRHRILSKTNGGQASARNLGMTVATGGWVTFCDPDDFLATNYVSELCDTIRTSGETPPSMYVTRLVKYVESSGKFSSKHPLNYRFRSGSRTVHLRAEPGYFHMHGPTAVVKREHLLRLSLNFNEELRFNFEDAHFVAKYLLGHDDPTISFVTKAKYFYRIRATNDSAVQSGSRRPEKYDQVLEHGHLELIETLVRDNRPMPRWLEFMLIYDLLTYVRAGMKPREVRVNLEAAAEQRFHFLMERIMEGISAEAIGSYDLPRMTDVLRDALSFGYKGSSPSDSGSAVLLRRDVDRGLTLVRYPGNSDGPGRTLAIGDNEYRAEFANSLPIRVFGRELFRYHYLWVGGYDEKNPMTAVHDGSLAIRQGAVLDNEDAELWLFMDSPGWAGGHAEAMYWYSRHHSAIPTRFVLLPDSPDWERLSALGAELIEYGSSTYRLALDTAGLVATTTTECLPNLDKNPQNEVPGGPNYVFLTPIYTAEERHVELHNKTVDLVFAATTQDLQEILQAGSAYRFTRKELVCLETSGYRAIYLAVAEGPRWLSKRSTSPWLDSGLPAITVRQVYRAMLGLHRIRDPREQLWRRIRGSRPMGGPEVHKKSSVRG